MSLALAKIVAEAAQNKKAKDLVLQSLAGKSDLCDFQLICSGENDRQTKAIAQNIAAVCKETANIRPASVEGAKSGQWILMDYGSLIVHVFLSEVRDYYALDSLWPDSTIEL
jgi:ribosome-associated protein